MVDLSRTGSAPEEPYISSDLRTLLDRFTDNVGLGYRDSLALAYLERLYGNISNSSDAAAPVDMPLSTLLPEVSPIVFNHVYVHDSVGQSSGGAVSVLSAAVLLRKCRFERTSAKKSGGAVISFNSVLQVEECHFEGLMWCVPGQADVCQARPTCVT